MLSGPRWSDEVDQAISDIIDAAQLRSHSYEYLARSLPKLEELHAESRRKLQLAKMDRAIAATPGFLFFFCGLYGAFKFLEWLPVWPPVKLALGVAWAVWLSNKNLRGLEPDPSYAEAVGYWEGRVGSTSMALLKVRMLVPAGVSVPE